MYAQFVGRGGRDGHWAECWLVMNAADLNTSRHSSDLDTAIVCFWENSTTCRTELFYRTLQFPWPLPDGQKITGPCCDICTPGTSLRSGCAVVKLNTPQVNEIQTKLDSLRTNLSSLHSVNAQRVPTDALAGLDMQFINKILSRLRLGHSLDDLGWKPEVQSLVTKAIQSTVPSYPEVPAVPQTSIHEHVYRQAYSADDAKLEVQDILN